MLSPGGSVAESDDLGACYSPMVSEGSRHALWSAVCNLCSDIENSPTLSTENVKYLLSATVVAEKDRLENQLFTQANAGSPECKVLKRDLTLFYNTLLARYQRMERKIERERKEKEAKEERERKEAKEERERLERIVFIIAVAVVVVAISITISLRHW